jgi:hypothetical protein
MTDNDLNNLKLAHGLLATNSRCAEASCASCIANNNQALALLDSIIAGMRLASTSLQDHKLVGEQQTGYGTVRFYETRNPAAQQPDGLPPHIELSAYQKALDEAYSVAHFDAERNCYILEGSVRIGEAAGIAVLTYLHEATKREAAQPDELWFIETVDQAIRRHHPQLAHKRAYSGDIARELLTELHPFLRPSERESVVTGINVGHKWQPIESADDCVGRTAWIAEWCNERGWNVTDEVILRAAPYWRSGFKVLFWMPYFTPEPPKEKARRSSDE